MLNTYQSSNQGTQNLDVAYVCMCVCVCVCVCLCVCVYPVSQQWSNQVAISMHLWWRHPFGKCVSSLHICMQEREFTLYQCGVTQDDQEHCNCAWLPLPTPSRLQVRAGFSLLSPPLSFSFVLLSSPFAPSMCCTYLNPVVKCYNICEEIMHPFLSSLFHFILLLPIVPFFTSTVLPCSLYPQNITDEEFHHESKWLYTCKPPLTHTHRCIVIACLSLSPPTPTSLEVGRGEGHQDMQVS